MIRITSPDQIGPVLADLRAMHGLTQHELAADAGVSAPRMNNWEHGTLNPTTPTLLKLLGAMGLGLAIVPVDETTAVNARWERLIETLAHHIRMTARGETAAALSATESDTEAEGHTRVGAGEPKGSTRLSGGADVCGHCGGSLRGYASLGDVKLCHPDDGMDCYRLVTVYGHGAPCITQPCYDPEPWRRSEAQTWNWTPTADGGAYSGPHGPDICPAIGCRHEGGAA
jgi:transcriptional regulator with XRE-family HTH domain